MWDSHSLQRATSRGRAVSSPLGSYWTPQPQQQQVLMSLRPRGGRQAGRPQATQCVPGYPSEQTGFLMTPHGRQPRAPGRGEAMLCGSLMSFFKLMGKTLSDVTQTLLHPARLRAQDKGASPEGRERGSVRGGTVTGGKREKTQGSADRRRTAERQSSQGTLRKHQNLSWGGPAPCTVILLICVGCSKKVPPCSPKREPQASVPLSLLSPELYSSMALFPP